MSGLGPEPEPAVSPKPSKTSPSKHNVDERMPLVGETASTSARPTGSVQEGLGGIVVNAFGCMFGSLDVMDIAVCFHHEHEVW
jgi:hypothetical protein